MRRVGLIAVPEPTLASKAGGVALAAHGREPEHGEQASAKCSVDNSG